MRKPFLLILFFATAAYLHAQTGSTNTNEETKTRQELFQLRKTFFDAQKQGNRAALEQLLADSFYFVHSTGVVEQRKEFIDRTVAQAARSPEIEFPESKLFVYDDHTAVWLTHSVSRAKDGTETNFRATDVLVKKGENWQWVSVNSTKLATRPKLVAVADDTLKMYVGQYRINPERTLTVTLENGMLIGQAPGLRQRELVPQSSHEFIWFSPDSNVDMRISFTSDEKGNIVYAVLNTEGNVMWKATRINGSAN